MKQDIKNNFTFIFLWRQCDWGLFKRRNEALLIELARRDVVESALHVEPLTPRGILGLIVRWWQAKDDNLKQVYKLHCKKAFSFTPILANGEKKIFVYSIFVLYPWGNIAVLKKVSNFLIRLQVNIINKKFVQSKKNVVLVAYPPSSYLPEAINTIKHDILIADLVDDVIARTKDSAEKNKYIDIYRTILPRCKWIFSTSPVLDEYRRYAGQDIEYLPNGVDSDEFSLNPSKNYFENHNQKIVGYVGNIKKTVDLDLLEYIVAYYHQVDFVLIGPADKEKLKYINKIIDQYSNCYYLGERKFTEIPGYLASFDVLISFKSADFSTSGGDSLKIYQYLASGKPIVTTPVSPANRFADLIYVAHDKFQFVEYLRRALTEDDREISRKRINAALENTWAKRIDTVLCRISNLLSN